MKDTEPESKGDTADSWTPNLAQDPAEWHKKPDDNE